MSFIGNNTTPGSSVFWDGFGNCQFGSTATMPTGGGVVTALDVYVDGDASTPSAKLCIWDGSGNLLWSSSSFSLNSKSHTIGGQEWWHVTVPSVYVAAGTVRMGFWTNGNVVWSGESSGTVNYQRSVSSAGSFTSGGSEGSGGLGAYITYTLGNVQVKRAGVWTYGVGQVYRSGSPVAGIGYVMRAGIWVPGA